MYIVHMNVNHEILTPIFNPIPNTLLMARIWPMVPDERERQPAGPEGTVSGQRRSDRLARWGEVTDGEWLGCKDKGESENERERFRVSFVVFKLWFFFFWGSNLNFDFFFIVIFFWVVLGGVLEGALPLWNRTRDFSYADFYRMQLNHCATGASALNFHFSQLELGKWLMDMLDMTHVTQVCSIKDWIWVSKKQQNIFFKIKKKRRQGIGHGCLKKWKNEKRINKWACLLVKLVHLTCKLNKLS